MQASNSEVNAAIYVLGSGRSTRYGGNVYSPDGKGGVQVRPITPDSGIAPGSVALTASVPEPTDDLQARVQAELMRSERFREAELDRLLEVSKGNSPAETATEKLVDEIIARNKH